MELELELLVAVSCIIAIAATVLSILVLRKVSGLSRQTSQLKELLEFDALLRQRREVRDSIKSTESVAAGLEENARELRSDLSQLFVGVAQLLAKTRSLDSNPHPKMEASDLEEINQRLLSLGENSLRATRRTEKLGKAASKLGSGSKELRGVLDEPADRP
jgi:chromosome segregation ATPase